MLNHSWIIECTFFCCSLKGFFGVWARASLRDCSVKGFLRLQAVYIVWGLVGSPLGSGFYLTAGLTKVKLFLSALEL